MIVRLNQKNKDIFEAVKSGRKKIETRAATSKYKNIEVGEILTFVCGQERCSKTIKKVSYFKTIKALLKMYLPKKINPTCKTETELTDMYYSFPGYKEKIAEVGLVALELGD